MKMSKKQTYIIVAICVVVAGVLGIYHGRQFKRLRHLSQIATQVCETQYNDLMYREDPSTAAPALVEYLQEKKSEYCDCFARHVLKHANDYTGLPVALVIEKLVKDPNGYGYDCIDSVFLSDYME